MRLPVAATDRHPGGFTWTQEGELVMAALTCDRDIPGGGAPCDCTRSFAGLKSGSATSLAVVRDVDIDLAELRQQVRECLAGGWPCEPQTDPDDSLVAELCVEMIEIGALFPEGTFLARADDVVIPVDDAA